MFKNWIKNSIKIKYLIILLIILFLGLLYIELNAKHIKYSHFQKQEKAANLMKKNLNKIKLTRLEKGIDINNNLDPNQTGIIGDEITKITTTQGNLEAKRTAINPDFAALMIKYFNQIGLKEGDYIAIGASGSFPSLIVAVLSAAKVMELNPLLIYSFGSSMYGANIPEFTFIDMLNNLEEFLPYSPIAVSLGGENDQAKYMIFDDSQDILLNLAKETKTNFIYENNLADSIKKRMELYKKYSQPKNIKTFINIGGAASNFGALTNSSLSYPNGLVLNPPQLIPNNDKRGLIYEYSVRGIPVIHLLNIRDLAVKNGLKIDPKPLPEIGESKVYYEVKYNYFVIFVYCLGIIIFFIYMWFKKINNKKII